MSRLSLVDPSSATGKSKELLDAVKAHIGMVPNMTKAMANSPAVLESYLGFSGALGHGLLDKKLREEIALVISQQNACDYCLSAHTAIGKMVGLTPQQVIDSRKGEGETPSHTAGLVFAKRVLETRGQVTEDDITTIKAAGFGDGEIAEIIAHVALNVFTNYFNIAADVPVDFPKVSAADIA